MIKAETFKNITPSFIYPQSDSNLTNYQFGSGTGDTSPMDNSSMYGQQQQQLSSPFKGDAMNKANERNSDYEPFHTRSSFNLNFNGNSITPAVQKVDKATMYSADIMVRHLSILFQFIDLEPTSFMKMSPVLISQY